MRPFARFAAVCAAFAPSGRDVDAASAGLLARQTAVVPRGRLSYRRAAAMLVTQTGWTLHQFRHSALTHLAEADVQLPLLMAKSRHRSLRTLQRYARPGPDPVAAMTAAHDSARRR